TNLVDQTEKVAAGGGGLNVAEIQVRMLALQDRAVSAQFLTGCAIDELSQIGDRQAPTGEFPVEHQQRWASDGVADAQILDDEIAMHQRRRNWVTAFFNFAPARFKGIHVGRGV